MDTGRKKYTHISSRKRKSEDTPPSVADALKCSVIGLLFSLSATLVILCTTIALCLNTQDPESIVSPLASFLGFPCAILGSFLSVKFYKGSPMLCAVLYGLTVVVLSIVLYPILPAEGSPNHSALSFFLMRGLLVLCCVFGAIVGAKSSTPKKRRRRR